MPRGRIARLACASIVLVASTGCGASTRSRAPDSAPTEGELLLLDMFGTPLPGRTLLVAGAVVRTDDTGRVGLPDLPGKYDVTCVGNDTVRTFLGMSTRAPVIRFPDVYNNENVGFAKVHVTLPADLGLDEDVFFAAGAQIPDVERQRARLHARMEA